MNYSFIDKEKQEKPSKKGGNRVSFAVLEPKWTLDEIILPKHVKEQLGDVISFCKNKEKIIQDWELYKFMKGKGCIGVNLWGIPGTGKSIAAEAIANALGMGLIEASYSSIMDSLQGNTEKNITALFEKAVSEHCVILFDEADGLLSARKTGGANSDTANLIKSHLLNILDRSTAIVVFTTNFFKSYDRAFVRRILWNIEVPAPGYEELIGIWGLHLGRNVPKELSYEELAQLTLDISTAKKMAITGGDIKKLTLMFCTQLTAQRYSKITREVASSVISKYLDDLEEGTPKDRTEKVVAEHELSDRINKELN